LNLIERDPDALADVNAEHALGTANSTPIEELRPRIDLAFRFTVSWSAAAGDYAAGKDGVPFSYRIDEMQRKLQQLYALLPLSDVFPGKDAVAAYNAVSAQYAQLYRDLVFSVETLPQPTLLENAAGFGQALIDAPVAAVTGGMEKVADGVARLLGGTVGAVWSALWPWLLIAGGVGAAWLFRAPLGRALGKVTK
jgi:hypothetical protein